MDWRLLYAAEAGDVAAAQRALREGASLDCTDPTDKRAPLSWAASGALPGHTAVLRSLLSQGAAVDAVDRAGCTALLYAAKHGRRENAQLLLSRGANLEAKAVAREADVPRSEPACSLPRDRTT